MKLSSRLTIVLLLVVAGLHLVRLVGSIPVTVGMTPVPLWVSALGVVVPVALAIGLSRETRR